jgi:ABC-2 type transport system permease protein/sodium transport system permease protein
MSEHESETHPPSATGRADAASQQTPLGLFRLLRLCRKELREILRDRRTIVTLFLMPLLAYPLLSMAFQRLVFTSNKPGSQLRCIVGLESDRAARQLEPYLGGGEALILKQRQMQRESGIEVEDETDSPSVEFRITDDVKQSVRDGSIDVGVRITSSQEARPSPGMGPPLNIELITRENSTISAYGASFIDTRLRSMNERFMRDLLADAGLPATLPISYGETSVTPTGAAFSLTTFVPLILILMTITGAVYPAIDLTAGERERGTLETLMAAPVPRFGLLFAKYIAVVTVAMLTATANLVAMSVTLLATGLGPVVFGPQGPTLTLIGQVFILLMLFASFFCAILLALTSFARSFKEAQAYLIPLMLITMAPGIMSLVPNLEFNGVLAVVPLVNIVLLARDLLEGNVDPVLAAAAILSTLFYAVAAITLAARIFGTDAVLYGSQATWSDLFRRPDIRTDTPSVSGTMLCLAIVYPLYFLLANTLYRLSGTTMSSRLLVSAFVTIVLFTVLPIAAAILQRTRLRTTFQLRLSRPAAWLGAAVLGVSLWPFAHEVFLLNELIGIKSLSSEQIESVEKMLVSWKELSPVIILLTMSLTPAVCEEFFFRGYLMGALQKAVTGKNAIIVSAVLFGVFHVITTSVLATERFLPSTFLGLVLGWVCLRTGSVLPGMLLHAAHNGLLLLIAYYREDLAARGWGLAEQSHMPVLWLVAAAAGVLVGGGLVWLGSQRRK